MAAAPASKSFAQETGQSWEKALWKKHGKKDNYTDETFLQHLVVNASVPPRSYWPLVLSSAAVTQQLACVVAAGAVPLLLHEGRLSAGAVLAACGLLLALGYGTCALLGGHLLGGSVTRGVRQCLLLVGGVYGLAPLLRSLAATTSTDSVVALAVGGGIVNLALCDYGFITNSGDTERLTGALSLGSGVMAAVLLASRMRSEAQVFAQILLSLELFLLSPYVRRHVRQRASRTAHVGLTLAMVAAATGLLLMLPPQAGAGAGAVPPHIGGGGSSAAGAAAAAFFLAAAAGVTFAAPAALVRAHKFKAKISGPWDEAAPHIPRELVPRPMPLQVPRQGHDPAREQVQDRAAAGWATAGAAASAGGQRQE